MEPTQPTDIKQLDDLKADPRNPRRMSQHDAESLGRSMDRFGDLSCVVFNVRTQQLVGGHQRVEMMKRLPHSGHDKRVIINQRFDSPDETGTVALGLIYVNNRPFAYREVDWDETTQKAANIAANRIQGEFDLDLLAEINYELKQLDNGVELLEATGQTQDEIDNLLSAVAGDGGPEPAGDAELSLKIKLLPNENEVIQEALGNAYIHVDQDQAQHASRDGAALTHICRMYLDLLHNQINSAAAEPVAEAQHQE